MMGCMKEDRFHIQIQAEGRKQALQSNSERS